MNKTIRVGTIKDGERAVNVFCKIEITDGKLSISGVEGPKSNGDAVGSCGQIIMGFKEYDRRGYKTLADIKRAPGWTPEMLKRFFDVWDEWHLNDMRANCKHQIGPEWEPKEVTLYHFRLRSEVSKFQDATKAAAMRAIEKGETFTPTAEQTEKALLEYSLTYHSAELPAKIASYYEPKKPLWAGDKGATETKSTNWLNQSEHPEGYLSKPCPVCGYKYGHEWKREELPAEVVKFLESLPDTDITPAWV